MEPCRFMGSLPVPSKMNKLGIWNLDGMTPTGGVEVLAETRVGTSFGPPRILQGRAWNRNGSSPMRGHISASCEG